MNFQEILAKIENTGLKFELQKSGKNKGAVKVKTPLGVDGLEMLGMFLKTFAWSGSTEQFLEYVRNDLMPKPVSQPRHDSTPKLQSSVVEHPDISVRQEYVTLDLDLLKPIRFVAQDDGSRGRIVLAHTGASGAVMGNTYALVSTASQGSGAGFTSALRSALASIPASVDWQEKQVEKAIQAKRAEILAQYTEKNGELEEPYSNQELEQMAQEEAEQLRGEIASQTAKCTMLKQCNDSMISLLEKCSACVKGVEGAHDAFVQAMRNPNFPLLFCRAKGLRAWYYTVTTNMGDGKSFTSTFADRFSYEGDYVDLIAENLGYLWGVPQLCVPMPKIFTNDPTVPCFHYYDLESVKRLEGEYPAWGEFLSRFTTEEADVFKAFVWSIFDAENRGRQCLYLLDRGYSGKSAVINAISHAIGGELHAALSKESLSNQFAFSKVWDKRFVTIGDNKNPNLVRSQAMHSMLGGDIVDVEFKGKDPFPSRLQCKVFVASNVPLSIDAKARNEYTRVLPIHPDDSDETLIARGIAALDENGNPLRMTNGNIIVVGDPTWEGRLKEEFRVFLASCYPVYQRLCPKRMDIVMPERSTEILATFDDDRAALLEEILERNFMLTRDDTDFITGAEMQRAFVTSMKEDDTYREARLTFQEWKEFLRRRYNIEATRSRTRGLQRGYSGIKLVNTSNSDNSIL